MPSPLTKVDLCTACAERLWPALQSPSMHEGLLLVAVAHELEKCERCKRHGPQLRAAGRRAAESNGDGPRSWAWVSKA